MDEWRRRCEGRIQEKVPEQVMKSTMLLEEQRKVRVCYYCGQKGHIQWYCPVMLKEKETEARKRQENSKAVQHQEPVYDKSNRGVCFTATTGGCASDEEKWIVDTGCSKHMTRSTVSLGWWNPYAEKVSVADGRTVKAKGSGTGRIIGRGLEGEIVDIKVKELLYVPELSTNVLSVSRMTDEGYYVQFGPKDCRILDGGIVVAVGEKIDGLYYLKQ
ncbi:hypothetical protein RP20_CCG028238 [Aedes albopictus]|nr:hypothetical protein RP20_CCG028238 [Aedes albopictus]